MFDRLIDILYDNLIKLIIFLNYFSLRSSFRFIRDNYNDDLIGVEIGVLFGNNSKLILKNLPINKLFLIDPYEDTNTANKAYTYSGPVRKKIANKKLKKYSSKIEWFYDYSYNVVQSIPDNLDFVYIDGNHSHDSVKIDIELFYKKIKKGGCLCGHDFNIYDVASAVVEFAKKNELKVNTGGYYTDWWIIKE